MASVCVPGGLGSVIRSVPRDNLLQAMDEFDKQLHATEQWSDWEQSGTHKYAIAHGGRRYPVP